MTEKQQDETFGFTLRQIADSPDFTHRLFENERGKSIY
jgi:hypothetical protein